MKILSNLAKRSCAFALIVVFIFASTANAAGTVSWDGSSSNAWATAGNWTVVSGTPSRPPGAGDDVIIGDFVPGSQPTLSANTTINSLTINGRSATSSTRRGGTLTINTGVTLTITGNLAINGSTGGGTGIALLGINASAGSGSVSVGGDVTLTNSTGGPPEEPRISMGSGTLTVTGNMALGTAATFTRGTSTVRFNKTSGIQTLNDASADNFNTITKTGAGTLQLLSNVPIVSNLTISAGTFDLSTFTANRTAAGGTLTVSNGATLMIGGTNTVPSNYSTHSIGGTSTVEYAGTTQSVIVLNSFQNYGNLTISGSGTKTLAGSETVTGNLTVSAGTFTVGAFTFSVTGTTAVSGTLSITSATGAKTFTGNVTINNGGTWNETASEAISFGGNLQNDGTLTDGGGTHTFTGTTKTLSGANAISIANVAVTGTYTNNGTLTVGTALSGVGSLTQGTNATLNLGGTSSITTLTATANPNTVNYNDGAAQTIKATTYHHLTLSGGGAKTTTGVTVNGILSMEGTATASAAPTYGASATLQYNTATGRTAGAEWITPFAATGGVIIANTGTITLNVAKVFNASVPLTTNSGATLATGNFQLTFGGNFVNNGTFTAGSSRISIANTMAVQSIDGFTTTGRVEMIKTAGTATFTGPVNGGELRINGTGGTLNLGTGLTHTFTGLWTRTAGTLNGGSSTLRIGGDVSGTGGTFTASTSTVDWYAASAQTVAGVTYNNLTLSGSGVKTLGAAAVVNATLTISSGATLDVSASNFAISLAGDWVNNGGTFTPQAGTVTLNGTGTQSIGGSSATTFNNLTYANTTTSYTASTTCSIGGTLTVNSSTNFSPSSGTITMNGSSITGSGTLALSELTIGAAVTASMNFGVNGVLTLNNNLSMGSNTLTMGASATTTGSGDVTGIVKRTTLVANTSYTFGNQYTTIHLWSGGTLPTDVSVKITVGSAPAWKTDAVQRIYDIIQNGASGSFGTINLHYLDAELNGNTANTLVIWDAHLPTPPGDVDEHGRSNYNSTENWVGMSSFEISYLPSAFGSADWTLGNSALSSATWNGSTSTVWTIPANWTPTGVPSDLSDVVIPDASTTTYDPTLGDNLAVGRLTINSSGILNSAATSTVIISGGSGAWSNNGGTFNASASTVIFTNAAATISGVTDFYNVTINSGAYLNMESGTTMRIGGTVINSGTWCTTDLNTTVEYNGGSQTVLNTNGEVPGYVNLILSGSGTKTMPGTALTIEANFSIAGTATVTAAAALTVVGNVTLGSGTTFNASTYTHDVAGNWTNNGGTFSAGTSTIQLTGTTDVTITGATTFNNLTVNKSASTNAVTLANDVSVATLAITQGNILTGSNVLTVTSDRTGDGLIIGTITRTHTFNASTSYTFEGPYTSLLFASGGTLPTSITLTTTLSSPGATTSMDPITRYYTISQTGGSGFSYTLRLHYEDTEVSAPNSETSPPLRVWRRTSTGPDIWTREGSSASNTTSNWVEQSGITNTGTFSLSSRTIANMVLTFLQSVTNPSPDEQVTYTLQYSNNGDGTSTNTLFTASAPLQTTYVGGSIKINGVAKTDAADADEVTVSGSSISINLGTVASGASGDFIYKVTVN